MFCLLGTIARHFNEIDQLDSIIKNQYLNLIVH